jgi:hypothetical protein
MPSYRIIFLQTFSRCHFTVFSALA